MMYVLILLHPTSMYEVDDFYDHIHEEAFHVANLSKLTFYILREVENLDY